MRLKVPVHRRIEPDEHAKPYAEKWRMNRILTASVILLMFVITVISHLFHFTLFDLVFAGVCVYMLCHTKDSEQFRKEIGMLELDEEIVFSLIDNEKSFLCKTYQYDEIAELCIGECPVQFFGRKSRGAVFSAEEWRAIYGGNYIIALDADGSPLFACSYSESVWKYLEEKCRNREVQVLTADAYTERLHEHSVIAQLTMKENGGQEILDQYEGYVN